MINIKKWLLGGTEQLDEQGIPDSETLIEAAGGLMDSNYVADIMGTVLFEAEDGRFFKGEIQFVLEPVTEEEARTMTGEDKQLTKVEEDLLKTIVETEKLEATRSRFDQSDGG